MTDRHDIPDLTSPWLDATGADAELIVCTRVRLARNLAGHRFASRSSDADRLHVEGTVSGAAADAPSLAGAHTFQLPALSRDGRAWLHEQQLISRELAGVDEQRPVRSGAAALVTDGLSVMVNEEDHIRLQGLRAGFALDAAYRATDRLDRELGARISFAFHPEFGYLTGCPTNVGTGLRASVLIHLPGLVLTKEIGKVLEGLAQVGLTFRGLYGEGSDVVGNLFQLSNQTTLGKSEAELLEHLGALVRQVLDCERRAEAVLRRDAPRSLDDMVWRAYGVLRHARTLSFEETLNLLSGVRLGVATGIIPGVSLATLNRLIIAIQPAHLARAGNATMDDDAMPALRAATVRRALEEGASLQ